MNTLSIDLFISLIRKLSFCDVAALCATCKKFQNYGLNYSVNWKVLISQTYGNVYNYLEKVREIQNKVKQEWTYLVYTQIIYLCDPVTVAMFKYIQEKLIENTDECYIALWLLSKKNEEKFTLQYPVLYKLEYQKLSETELHLLAPIMVRYGTVVGLSRIINRIHDLSIRDSHIDYDELYRAACNFGRLDIVQYLDEFSYCRTTQKGREKLGCLSIAVEHGHLRLVDYLLLTEEPTKDYLIKTCEKGYLDILKSLLEKNNNLFIEMLLTACTNNHLHIVEYLSDFLDICANNTTAIKYAALCGNVEIVRYLISLGADIKPHYDEIYETAKRYGYSDILELLSEISSDK